MLSIGRLVDPALAKMRTLYKKLGENKEWMSYITGFRERPHTLRALKEEMEKARLLS